jgi:phospholipase/carboxylesterase
VKIRNDGFTTLEQGWIVQVFHPLSIPATKVYLLLHGWTGDEHSMDSFASLIPQDSWGFAPRGHIKAQPSGYGWINYLEEPSDFEAYTAVSHALWKQFEHWRKIYKANSLPVHLIGFSQGAALTLTTLLTYPGEITSAASLAGFLPENLLAPLPDTFLQNKNILVVHGEQDTIIPLSTAQHAVNVLLKTGANVTFCQDNTGHRVSANCLNSLERFIKTSS